MAQAQALMARLGRSTLVRLSAHVLPLLTLAPVEEAQADSLLFIWHRLPERWHCSGASASPLQQRRNLVSTAKSKYGRPAPVTR